MLSAARMAPPIEEVCLASFLRELRLRIPREAAAIGSWKRLPIRCGRLVSQEEIAEALGVSRNWYRLLESGDEGVRASVKLLDRLASLCALAADERLQLFMLAIPEMTSNPYTG